LAGFEMDSSGNPEVFRGVPRLSFPPIGSPLARTGDPTVKVIGEMAAVLRGLHGKCQTELVGSLC
jgi:hypothetical protein